jgi:hypothetical protein
MPVGKFHADCSRCQGSSNVDCWRQWIYLVCFGTKLRQFLVTQIYLFESLYETCSSERSVPICKQCSKCKKKCRYTS